MIGDWEGVMVVGESMAYESDATALARALRYHVLLRIFTRAVRDLPLTAADAALLETAAISFQNASPGTIRRREGHRFVSSSEDVSTPEVTDTTCARMQPSRDDRALATAKALRDSIRYGKSRPSQPDLEYTREWAASSLRTCVGVSVMNEPLFPPPDVAVDGHD